MCGFKDEAMRFRGLKLSVLMLAVLSGCASQKPYGVEHGLYLPGKQRQTWAVAPAVNLSGQSYVDPILQADIVYQQLQQVHGLTVIPVNRVAEVYLSLNLDKVQSVDQARLVCELLGCDALVVPTVTAYDPYDPPKVGASLQLFFDAGTMAMQANVDPHELSREASPKEMNLPHEPDFVQAVGMFDAANGSVREMVLDYAEGRNDPKGPLAQDEYFVNMDRYSGFVYWKLIGNLLADPRLRSLDGPITGF
jgi:hypothetical protein